jgi:hypothetical protein
VLVLAGCGGDGNGGSGAAPPANKNSADSQPSQQANAWAGRFADTYETANSVCGAFPRAKTAKELGLPVASNAVAIAKKYAYRRYEGKHRQPAFEGCLAALRIIGG